VSEFQRENSILQNLIVSFQNLQTGVIQQLKYYMEQNILLNETLKNVTKERDELKEKYEPTTKKET
jgi:hypothetical protein